MSALAERTMLTRSGITRLVDGLVGQGLIERSAVPRVMPGSPTRA